MKILFAATVREFYRQRAGFFLLAIFLLFGFLTSREHYAFALFFLTDYWGMAALLVLWLGYALLCAQFLANQLVQPEYAFLQNAYLWPSGKRFMRLGGMALGFLMPIVFHGIYVASIARQDNLLNEIWPMFIYWLLLSILLGGVAEWRLHHPDLAASVRKSNFRLPFKRPNHFVFWTLEWLLRERGFTLLLSKIGVLLFMTGALVYDSTGTYDLRLPAVCFTLAYLLNAGLSYELYLWESEVWLWGKSLPFGKDRRFGRIALLHVILLLPETFLIVRYGTQLHAYEIVQLFLLPLGVLLFYHGSLYRKNLPLEETLQSLAVGFVILTFTILYKVPIALLAAILLVGAFTSWRRWYN